MATGQSLLPSNILCKTLPTQATDNQILEQAFHDKVYPANTPKQTRKYARYQRINQNQRRSSRQAMSRRTGRGLSRTLQAKKATTRKWQCWQSNRARPNNRHHHQITADRTTNQVIPTNKPITKSRPTSSQKWLSLTWRMHKKQTSGRTPTSLRVRGK